MAQDAQVLNDSVKDAVLNADISTIERIATLFIFDATRAGILVMWIFLIVLVVGFIMLLKAWNNDQTNDIVIADLICINGKLDESKMARFGAFVVSTWAFVYLVVSDGMTEWYFVGYMSAWVGNALFSKYMNEKNGASEHPKPPLADDSESDTSEEELTQEDEPVSRVSARKAARQRR